MTDIAFQSALSLAQRIRAGELSARELLDHYLQRVDKYNPALNAIVVDDRERAWDAAAAADRALRRGQHLGPLHGVPMTVKESFDVAGLLTTWGDPALENNLAITDALAVARLKAAGAIIFGKTNVPLHLADWQTYNDIYGTTHNPWDSSRTPGGSSGGAAAALAAGLTGLELGSDIGGSIRNPAHYCGLFGHKPSYELIPSRGHSAAKLLAPADIGVIGPLARSAADLKATLLACAGPDQIQARGYQLALTPPRATGLGEFRVAVWQQDAFAPVSEAICKQIALVAEAFAFEGAFVNFDARPDFEPAEYHRLYNQLLRAAMGTQRDLSHPQWLVLNEVRTQLRWAWQRFFEVWDVLIAPIAATPAFPQDQRAFAERSLSVDAATQPYWQQLFWAGLPSLCYLPATVIPTGYSAEGLPIGVQIIGPELGDLSTLAAAGFLEQAGFRFLPPAGYP